MLLMATLATIFSCCSPDTLYKPLFSANFDSAAGPALLKQCSRSVPGKVSRFWNVANEDLLLLESHFSNIGSIKANGCCIVGMKMHAYKNAAFQYTGIIIGNRKYIYINAFPYSEITQMKSYQPGFDPAKTPIVVCDGGISFWGVLFDVETMEFSDLSFNGVG